MFINSLYICVHLNIYRSTLKKEGKGERGRKRKGERVEESLLENGEVRPVGRNERQE